jgi:hypothetical protein
MGMVIHWPGSRSASAAKTSKVTPQALPDSDLTQRSQNLAGIVSLDRHLRMVDDGTPMSAAIAMGDGQQAITSRKDENIVPFVDQIGPRCKTKLERDKMSHQLDSGSQKGTRMAKALSAEQAAFIDRVRRARLSRFGTMEPIAALLRITVAQYKHYEKRSPLPAHLVVPFCHATQVDVYWLLDGSGKVPEFAATPVAAPRQKRASKARKAKAA